MKLSKRLLLLIAILGLLLLIASPFPMLKSIEKDPPSIFNLGPGGLSLCIPRLALYNEINVIFSFSELHRFNPEKHALIIMGPDQELDGMSEIIGWVNDGGIAVVLDEFDQGLNRLTALGVLYGSIRHEVGIAYCNYMGRNLTILVNVFREIYTANQGDTICTYNGTPIAVAVSHGKGKVVVVGDSSLTINNLCGNMPHWCNANILFVQTVTEGRELVLYEGGRSYRIVSSEMIAYVMSVAFDTLSNALRFALGESYTGRLLLITSSSFLSILFLALMFGLPRPIESYMIVRKQEGDLNEDFRKELNEKLTKVWFRGRGAE